ncbi:MAG: Asp-tRNA(Asn)/Glu-tRNA(Gln) amidotransferase subunit GatA [Cytophagales bacterium]|nr:Asp-tRNA(Asn)/Glu-tRNA(Gln) amidotransferase subunit GatA [Cytophagales bacterium]
MEHNYTTLTDIRKDIRSGVITVEALVSHYLKNIEANRSLNAFLEVYEEEALIQARLIDQKLANGKAGKLAGLVVGIKDVICHKDHVVTGGSQILKGFISQFSATAVKRLLAEDAIIIGRQNCDEFGMGSSNEHSAYGPVKNGIDPERVPGGSSGGSAVAVQMDMCQVALGSDTGGSVRQPAAFCGVYGLKPTYSRVSRHGLVAYASSFDTIGVLSKSLEDAAKVLGVIAGQDDYDSTVSRQPVADYMEVLSNEYAPNKIGVISAFLDAPGLDPDIKAGTEQLIERLEGQGHKVEEVSFDYLHYLLPTHYILTMAEASSNLSRYDGVRYGHRSEDVATMEEMYKKTRTEGFGNEVLRRILLGTYVLSASYYETYFNQAQKVRQLIRNQTVSLLEDYDFLLSPTTPTSAFKLGQNTQRPLEMYLADIFTVLASLAGIPAISIPIGTDKDGLPIAVQVMGSAFNEGELLSFSNEIVSLS